MPGLVFMGTSAFAVPALERLAGLGERIAAVYTQPPRPAGRGHRVQKSAVHAAAERLGLPVRIPSSLKDEAERTAFHDLGAELALVASYGLLLPGPILNAPGRGCFNLHASILPRWRGAAPIQRAIEAGDAATGVTIFRMETGLDTGPVLMERAVDIGEDETAGGLHDRLALVAADMAAPFLDGLRRDSLVPRPQPEEGVVYARKLEKAEGRLDLARPADELARKARAFAPRPGAWIERGGERLVLRRVEAVAGKGAPGTVIGMPLTIAAGAGALRVLEAQREGRRAMAADDLARGWGLAPGDRFR
ncbi:MAG: methionyl-tRNA formyltransferase [Geminicoccaceae bacterium]|nr:methionyl-tRNA formyltransferase [Geminicoccaceae bacterium]